MYPPKIDLLLSAVTNVLCVFSAISWMQVINRAFRGRSGIIRLILNCRLLYLLHIDNYLKAAGGANLSSDWDLLLF